MYNGAENLGLSVHGHVEVDLTRSASVTLIIQDYVYG